MAAKQQYLVRFVCDHNRSVGSNMANNDKQTTSWLTYKVQKWHTLPSGFDKQLRNSSTTLRNNLQRKQQQPRSSRRQNAAATSSYEINNTKNGAAMSSYEINNTPANTDANTQCSRGRQNFVSHEAESFAQRECGVITACLMAQKAFRAFANVNRRHAKLGSILLHRTQ